MDCGMWVWREGGVGESTIYIMSDLYVLNRPLVEGAYNVNGNRVG